MRLLHDGSLLHRRSAGGTYTPGDGHLDASRVTAIQARRIFPWATRKIGAPVDEWVDVDSRRHHRRRGIGPAQTSRAGCRSLLVLPIIVLTVALWSSDDATAGLVIQAPGFRLHTGQVIFGAFDVEAGGLFLHTEVGGKLFRWTEVEAASLSPAVRESARQVLLAQLRRGHHYYDREHVHTAQLFFQRVLDATSFLLPEDLASPLYANISEKARGLVLHEGHWIPFETRQRALGLEQHRGRWLPAAEVAEIQAFERVFRIAESSRDYAETIVELRRVMATYPRSVYIDVARQVLQRLVQQLRPVPVRDTDPATPLPVTEPPLEAADGFDYWQRYPVIVEPVERPDACYRPSQRQRPSSRYRF